MKPLLRFILVFIFCYSTSAAIAQLNINGDFECLNENGKPTRWFVPPTRNQYSIESDTTGPFSGIYSGRIVPSQNCSKLSSMVCYQELGLLKLKPFRKLTVNYHFRVNSGWAESIKYWIRPALCPGNQSGISLIDTTMVSFKGNMRDNNWYEMSVDMFLKPEAFTCQTLFVGFTVQDSTDLNVDKIEISFDDQKMTDLSCITRVRSVPDSNDINWLEKVYVPLSETDSEINMQDLKKQFTDARVIGLGESTHGTKEFTTLRTKFIRYLIDSMDFEVIAFENNFAESHQVNALLSGKKYTTEKVIDSLFGRIHETRETLELFNLVRNKNSTGRKKIFIEGFDDQNPRYLGNLLLNDFYKKDQACVEIITKNMNTGGSWGVQQYDSMIKRADRLILRFKAIKQKLTRAFPKTDIPLLEKKIHSYRNSLYLNYLYSLQNAYITFNIAPAATYRDSLMAENVLWLLKYYKNKKIILLGHNEHLQKNATGIYKTNVPQGYFIQQKLPAGLYKAFAFTTALGMVTSYNKNNEPESILLTPPNKFSYEFYFSQLPAPLLYLPLKNSGQNDHPFITKTLQLRWCGYRISGETNQFQDVNIADGYDGLFFIRKTSPASSFWYKKGKLP